MAVDFAKWRSDKDETASFYVKPFDAAAARQKMIERINRTVKQLNGERVAPKGGKDFQTLENNGVIYKPTLNDHPIEFAETGDEDGFHTTREKLLDMLPHLIAHIEDGALDDQLKAALTSKSTPVPSPATGNAQSGSNKAGGATRNVSEQSKLNIGVAGKRRGKDPASFDDIREFYIQKGHDSAKVDAAIALRKTAEAEAS
jgi:hypothetical protein